MALASPIYDRLSINGPLLQGTFKIGSGDNGLNSVMDQYMNIGSDGQTMDKLFNEFKHLYNKSYQTIEHEQRSAKLFNKRLTFVLENNLKALYGQSSYTMTIHGGSDLPLEEILVQPPGRWPSVPKLIESTNNDSTYINSWIFDYRSAHQVTPIVNQGGCGACVYFAAAACIESFWARKGHGLIHLSPQQLNDCARDEAHGNHGCQHGGGTFIPTFNYIRSHGLTSMQNYPYVARDENCRRDKESQTVARIGNWHPMTPHGDEMALERSVHDHGPNAVAIHVSDQLAHYRAGIFDGECHGGRNHAVLVIGYGWDDGQHIDYWIIKNQWGDGWGEHGFLRLRRKHGNMCDVAGDAVWVE
ncbi:hypothetical protein RDWZM_006863 [Blomia tropicalis]|uniref:Uncharacterized protein n=1 Tax=Blomia tropicalis TaxID=40697 RepID=A0A9Q0RPP6_BLOTA|nr:hypothetical protein RDWZM_006863 [Blomia tropicalis]